MSLESANNLNIVESALNLLYDTYIIDTETADARGVAIQAVNALYIKLGGNDLVGPMDGRV